MSSAPAALPAGRACRARRASAARGGAAAGRTAPEPDGSWTDRAGAGPERCAAGLTAAGSGCAAGASRASMPPRVITNTSTPSTATPATMPPISAGRRLARVICSSAALAAERRHRRGEALRVSLRRPRRLGSIGRDSRATVRGSVPFAIAVELARTPAPSTRSDPPDPSRAAAGSSASRSSGRSGRDGSRLGRLAVRVLRVRLGDRRRDERRPAARQLEQHAAERVGVGAPVDLSTSRPTARAPCTRACPSCPTSSATRSTSVPDSFAMPKSRTFTRSPLARSSSGTRKMLSGLRSRWMMPWRVRRVEDARDLAADLDRPAPTAARRRVEPLRERLALEQLHDQVRLARCESRVEDLHRAGVLDLADRRAPR